MSHSMTTQQPWPWPETMDALLAAPASHRVLLNNDRVRVLEVVIEPGAREPEHTHQAASLMILDEPAQIRYYLGGTLRLESQKRSGTLPGVRMHWLEPEGPHSVENIAQQRYHAIASNSSSASAMLSPDSRSPSTGQDRPGTGPATSSCIEERGSPTSGHGAARAAIVSRRAGATQ